ncbi:MAG: 2-oxo acid dehydrogenase subunit E2 [Mariniphaga sp.]|nr:2-oxo acid dehydrogenase subunit E2 [Mariniphaga sp.]
MNNQTDFNNNWRKVAATIYKKPSDSKIFGTVEIDVTELEKYISDKRKEGLKITLTHVIVLIVARALKQEVPELNTYVKRGNIVHRNYVDATVSVLLPGGRMGSVKVKDADNLTLKEIVDLMSGEIKKSRKGDENSTMQSKHLLASIPWPFRNWVFRLYKMFTIDWGISLPFLGLNSDSFGSFVISNIGSIGLDMGYPSLLPSSNVAFVMIMGGIYKKPVVVNDEIVVRRIMSLGAALDHRVTDASQGGKLFRFIKYMVKNPELLEEKP